MSALKPQIFLRYAKHKDLQRIVEIHNDVIREGGLTADMTPYKPGEKSAWFEVVSRKPYAILILAVDETIVGFVYLSPWRGGRAALRQVAEISYYLLKSYRGAGYGRKLLQEGMRAAKENGIKTLLAILLDSNMPSISLLESEGFHVAGHLPQVAELKDSIAGQFIMIKQYTDN
jgi:L-amino acid N-acyltransferase YncA